MVSATKDNLLTFPLEIDIQKPICFKTAQHKNTRNKNQSENVLGSFTFMRKDDSVHVVIQFHGFIVRLF